MAYPTDDLPFFLDLKSIHGHDSVKCEQLLRDLPGKRKVFGVLGSNAPWSSNFFLTQIRHVDTGHGKKPASKHSKLLLSLHRSLFFPGNLMMGRQP